jgi:hypothetical protein
MGKGADRPRANAKPVDTNQPLKLLQRLLDIELARLDVAVRIEKERNIVFPETTIIIRDIVKLQKAITTKEEPEKPDEDEFWNI